MTESVGKASLSKAFRGLGAISWPMVIAFVIISIYLIFDAASAIAQSESVGSRVIPTGLSVAFTGLVLILKISASHARAVKPPPAEVD